jgi:hypothetical protein
MIIARSEQAQRCQSKGRGGEVRDESCQHGIGAGEEMLDRVSGNEGCPHRIVQEESCGC